MENQPRVDSPEEFLSICRRYSDFVAKGKINTLIWSSACEELARFLRGGTITPSDIGSSWEELRLLPYLNTLLA